jgi:hypothetical protein
MLKMIFAMIETALMPMDFWFAEMEEDVFLQVI